MIKNILSIKKLFCATPLIALAMISLADASDVGVKNRRANRLYDNGRYEEALKLYDEALEIDPRDGKLKMNRGSALYRLEDFDEAERSYLDALPNVPQNDKKTLADAHYNLGNVQFRQGERLESAGDVSSARDKYAQALDSYINTLKLRPNDRDAKWNLQLAHEKIDLMQQQQQERGDDGDDGDQNKERDNQGDREDRDQEQNREQDSRDERDSDDQNEEQQEEQDRSQPQERDDKRDEAERLIEQFADDDEDLNKPPRRQTKSRQPEKDW